MEIYALDRKGQLDFVVEKLESFIWTERMRAYGDFEMVIQSTPMNRARYTPEVRIIHSLSNRVMVIKTVSDEITDEGKKILIIKGYSLESLMLDKIARGSATSYPYNWVTNKKPAEHMRDVYREIMVEGARTSKDILPDVAINLNPALGKIEEPQDLARFDWEPMSVYERISKVAEIYDIIGFSIGRDHVTGQLTFNVYTGRDRTSTQTQYPAVLFSASLDNLQNTRELKSSVDYKNVALVYSEDGILEVHATGISTGISGVNRRVMVVKADKLDGTPSSATITAHLTSKGREALAQHRLSEAFDGEVSQYSPYVYGTHYGLGDLVEYQNEDGAASVMMVTEQTFALDEQGFRTWPTLVLKTYVAPGSWVSWDANKEWDDLTTEVWNTMP